MSNENNEDLRRLAAECYQPGSASSAVGKHLPAECFGSQNWCAPSRKEYGFRISKANKIINDVMKERPDPAARPGQPLSGNSTFEILESLFTISQNIKVQQFLLKHSFLFPLILEAYSRANECFLQRKQFVLKVVEDHEEGCAVLLFAIQVGEGDVTALDMIDKFNESWWLANNIRAKSSMVIDLRFVPS